MDAIILSIGDELVLGQTLDTNSQYLSRLLASAGVGVRAHLTVGDEQSQIETAIRESAADADALIITGGLGPTDDDLTRQALAAVLGQPLELNPSWLDNISAFFKKLGRSMPEKNTIQAMIPRGATMLWNHHGTAAGIIAQIKSASRTCDVYAMPGVPKEMKPMFENDILPKLRDRAGGGVILSRALHTFGVGESQIAQMLGELMKRGREPSVGTTVSQGIVTIRVNSRASSHKLAQDALDATVLQVRQALGEIIYGTDDQTLPIVIADLLKRGSTLSPDADDETNCWTIATAESCTGGLLAKYLTDLPGSSAYFMQGYIVYSNLSKTMMLDVDPIVIHQHGAVSEPVVSALAARTRELASTDLAIAISGIAGPSGGTDAKPVGTVCIGLASANGVVTRTFLFPGDRDMIRDRAAKMALTMARFHLLGKPMPF